MPYHRTIDIKFFKYISDFIVFRPSRVHSSSGKLAFILNYILYTIYIGYTQYAMGEVHRPCSPSSSIFNPNRHGCTHYTRRREKIRIYHAQLFPIKKSCARQTNGASLVHDITIIWSFSDFVCS